MNASDPLALLDFTPRPLTCDTPSRDCDAAATVAVEMSCGCAWLLCRAHAAQTAAIAGNPYLVAVCHTHKLYGARVARMEEIEL